MPSDSSAELMAAALGDQVEQTAICDNGWSKVEAESEGEKVIGYMQTPGTEQRKSRFCL